MGLDKMITASVKVVAKNVLELHPGGTYNLSEDNEIERRVVNLHFVSIFADMAAAELSHNGECMQTLMGSRLEQLGESIFELYEPFIRAGVDVFRYNEFYNRKALEVYTNRTFVNGHMNPGPNERHPCLPEGWSYEFPGQCQKMFDFGFVVVDYDEWVRIGIYSNSTDDQPNDYIYICQVGDYRELYKKHLNHASEIATVCDFIYNENHI